MNKMGDYEPGRLLAQSTHFDPRPCHFIIATDDCALREDMYYFQIYFCKRTHLLLTVLCFMGMLTTSSNVENV